MVKYIIKLLIVAGAFLVAAYFVEGIKVDSFWPAAVLAAFVLGVLNITVRPIIKLFSLPVTILTLGLFGLLINILVFWLITLIITGVTIEGFMSAVWGLLIITIAGWIADAILNK